MSCLAGASLAAQGQAQVAMEPWDAAGPGCVAVLHGCVTKKAHIPSDDKAILLVPMS